MWTMCGCGMRILCALSSMLDRKRNWGSKTWKLNRSGWPRCEMVALGLKPRSKTHVFSTVPLSFSSILYPNALTPHLLSSFVGSAHVLPWPRIPLQYSLHNFMICFYISEAVLTGCVHILQAPHLHIWNANSAFVRANFPHSPPITLLRRGPFTGILGDW